MAQLTFRRSCGRSASCFCSPIRWREPIARWLAVIACVPLTSPLYESLPLFMAPWSFRQAILLALLSHAARWLMFLIDPARSFASVMGIGATITIMLVYLPAVIWLVRRPRDRGAAHVVADTARSGARA